MGEALEFENFPATKVVPELFSQEKAAHYWPMIEEELIKVDHLWSHRWTLESIRQSIEIGQTQVWGFGSDETIHFVMLTQIDIYPAAKVLRIFLALGTLGKEDEFMNSAYDVVESFAKACGCVEIEVTGRLGWAKKLARFGPRRAYAVLVKSVMMGSVH